MVLLMTFHCTVMVLCGAVNCMHNEIYFTVGIWSSDIVVPYSIKAEVDWEVTNYHCISNVSILLCYVLCTCKFLFHCNISIIIILTCCSLSWMQIAFLFICSHCCKSADSIMLSIILHCTVLYSSLYCMCTTTANQTCAFTTISSAFVATSKLFGKFCVRTCVL